MNEARKNGYPIKNIDIGGGFGIYYKGREAKPAKTFADSIVPVIKSTGCRLMLEPGRFIVGNAGIFVVKVLYTKQMGSKHFVVTDGGMSELIRPSLYSAYHRVWPVKTVSNITGPVPDESKWKGKKILSQVVGPICESGDFLAKNRLMPVVKPGDLLAVFSAGAYGYTMSSNYNSRPRPPEVLVSGKSTRQITKKETHQDLIRQEI